MIFQFSRWFHPFHPGFCFGEVFFGPSGNGEWLRSTMDTTSPMFVHLQGVTWWTDMKLDEFAEIDIQTKIIIWPWSIFGFEGFVFRDSFAYQKDFLQIISKMYNIERIVLGQKRRSFDAFLAKGSKPWCCSESQRRFPSNGQKHLQLARSKRCQRESLWRGRDAFETRLTEEFAVHWFQKMCLESPRSRSKDKHLSILIRSWSCDQDNNSTTTCFPLLSNEGRMAEGTTFEDGGPEREKRWKDYTFPMFFWLERDGYFWILPQLGDSGDDVEVEAEAWVAVKLWNAKFKKCRFEKQLLPRVVEDQFGKTERGKTLPVCDFAPVVVVKILVFSCSKCLQIHSSNTFGSLAVAWTACWACCLAWSKSRKVEKSALQGLGGVQIFQDSGWLVERLLFQLPKWLKSSPSATDWRISNIYLISNISKLFENMQKLLWNLWRRWWWRRCARCAVESLTTWYRSFFWVFEGEPRDSFIHVLLCIHLHGTNFLQDSRVGQKEEMATRVQLLSLKWLATLNIDKVDSQRFVGNTMPHQTKQRQSTKMIQNVYW